MEITLKYIAEIAKVSVSTVSRALRDDERVKPGTRERIKSLADRLNYIPNHQAQSLVTGKTKTIGLVIPNIRAFMHDILDGIEETLSPDGINILLGVYNNDGEKELSELKLLMQKRVDGIILFHISSRYDFQVVNLFQDSSIPLVLIDRIIPGGNYDSVVNNNTGGIDLLVQEAVDRGHSKLAFIYENEEVLTMKERVEGFLSALKKRNMDYGSEYLVTSRYHKVENGYEAMKTLVQLTNPPEVIIASTGDNILGVVRYLIEHPVYTNRFRVCGFDEMENLDLMQIPVTRLDMQEKELGRSAAELLLNRLSGFEGAEQQIVIDPVLIRRWS